MPDRPTRAYGSRNWRVRAAGAIETLEEIDEFVRGVTYEEFVEDIELLRAVEQNVSVVGSAILSIPEGIREQRPEVPWERIIVLRSTLVHEYWRPVSRTIWDTVIEGRRRLRDALMALLEDNGGPV